MAKPPLAARPAAAAAGMTPRAALDAIIALLEREQSLLVQPDADALQSLAAQKQALLNQMQAAGCNAPAAARDPALRALTMRAQQLNAGNAKLLALQRTSSEGRLQLLRGGQASGALYRANGYLAA